MYIFYKCFNNIYLDEKYKLEIYIYQTDILKVNTKIRHPSVIIYIVDTCSWEYLRKSEANVTKEEKAYIDPISTKKFDFKLHK